MPEASTWGAAPPLGAGALFFPLFLQGQRVFEHWAQLAVVTGHTLERAPVTSCVQTLPGLFHSRVCFLAPVQLSLPPFLVCGRRVTL